jgi:hypothetical protein
VNLTLILGSSYARGGYVVGELNLKEDLLALNLLYDAFEGD